MTTTHQPNGNGPAMTALPALEPLAPLAPLGTGRVRVRAAAAATGHGIAVGWRWARGRVRSWRVAANFPALAGAAMVSVGTGGLLQAFAGAGGWALGVLAGGLFLLRIDSRI